MHIFAFGSVRTLARRHKESAELTAWSFRGATCAIFVERGIVDFAFAEDALLRRSHLMRNVAAISDGAGFSD